MIIKYKKILNSEESHEETSAVMGQAESTKHGMPDHESRKIFQ